MDDLAEVAVKEIAVVAEWIEDLHPTSAHACNAFFTSYVRTNLK